jgi:hypothetical protein
MYSECRLTNNHNKVKMSKLGEVYSRVTRHMEDIDNARRKAEGHLHDTLYEL